MCSDRGMDPGVHQICFDVRENTKQFSEETFQSNGAKIDRANTLYVPRCDALFKATWRDEKYGRRTFCHAIPSRH